MTEKVSLWKRNEKKLKGTMVCDGEKTQSASTQTQTQKLSVRSRRAAVGECDTWRKNKHKLTSTWCGPGHTVNARRKKARKTAQHLNFCYLPHRHPPSSPHPPPPTRVDAQLAAQPETCDRPSHSPLCLCEERQSRRSLEAALDLG